MKTIVKVALLEDNSVLLTDYKRTLEENNLASVVVWCTDANEFIKKVGATKPDALLLDIDLGNNSMTGIEVAYKLKLPVMFVSAYNADNLKEIEHLKREFDFPVEHLTKPVIDSDLIKSSKKYFQNVSDYLNENFLIIDFKDSKRNKVMTKDIVCICADKKYNSDSNNKVIYFSNRKPEILVDFTFGKMAEYGFSNKSFIPIHRSNVVNVSNIKQYKKVNSQIIVECMLHNGEIGTLELSVSENFKF
jgi:CheY-like chemotaxis protein